MLQHVPRLPSLRLWRSPTRYDILFPARCSGHWEMVYDARTVFPRCQDVSYTLLVNIESTQLGYLSLILLAFIELKVLGC